VDPDIKKIIEGVHSMENILDTFDDLDDALWRGPNLVNLQVILVIPGFDRRRLGGSQSQ
jgi:hypothetical protein